MSYYIDVPCPKCRETVSIMVGSYFEYQGEAPMGACVTFVEFIGDVERECDCDITVDEWSTLEEQACEKYNVIEDFEEPDIDWD